MRKQLKLLLLLLTFLLGGGQSLFAFDNDEFNYKSNFVAYQMGNGKVQFEFLVFSTGTHQNHWANKGNESKIFYRISGTDNWIELAQWGTEENNFFAMDYGWFTSTRIYKDPGKVSFRMHPNGGIIDDKVVNHGSYVINNSSDGIEKTYAADDAYHDIFLKNDETQYKRYKVKLTWFIDPNSPLAGKKIDIMFYSYDQRSLGDHEKNTYTYNNIDLGEAIQTPTLYDPVFYPLGTSSACIMVPYSSTVKPTQYTTNKENPDVVHQLNDMAGTIYVNAEDTVQSNFCLNMHLRVDDVNTDVPMSSTYVNIPAYHRIYDFKAEPYFVKSANGSKLYKGAKKLSWVVKNPLEKDAVSSDTYELQRAYEKDFSDAVSVDQIMYKSSLTDSLVYNADGTVYHDADGKVVCKYEKEYTYEYIDSTEAAFINQTHPDQPVYYRVRRASSYYFGWDGHPYAATSSVDVPIVQAQLMQKNYANMAEPSPKVEKDKDWEKNRKVHFTLPLGRDFTNVADKYYQTWDSRARLKLVRRASTGSTESKVEIQIPNDSIHYVEPSASIEGANGYWEAHYTDAPSTPCVKYYYSVYVDVSDVKINKVSDESAYSEQGIIIPNEYNNLYFSNATPISSITASQGEYSDCTLLKWEQEGGFPDYYILERKLVDEDDAKYTQIASKITDTFFRDNTATPGQKYDYRLTSVVDCHGLNTNTKKTTGYRSAYAKVSGKVQFSNGISQAGVTVALDIKNNSGSFYHNPDEAQSASFEKRTTTTAADGSFTFENVPYTNVGTTYTIIPSAKYDASFTYGNSSNSSYEVTISKNNSLVSDINFYNKDYVRVSGRVLFEKSTVPVHNAHFTIDDNVVTTATGAVVKTDASGNFELTAPKGAEFTLKAEMDGHTFANGGTVQIGGSDKITLTKNLDGVRIYDQTKVRLIGRVVGGDTQGDMTLGFGLSKNNLGDNLQFVMQLEGDNISSLVFDENDLTYKTGSAEFAHLTDGQKTKVDMEQTRIVVKPDPVSGEYIVDLFPVKYKITQATAQGYATLFNKGVTNQTLDLTNALTQQKITYEGTDFAYNEKYNIIYHSDPTLTVDQYTYGTVSKYLGEPSYDYLDIDGRTSKIPTYSIDKDNKVSYTFGYPIFNSGYAYTFRLTASEDYYYNNQANSEPDRVLLANNKVKIYNGFCTTDSISEVMLDSKAQAIVSLPVNNPYFAVGGEDAVRSVEMSLALNGDYVKSNAIKGYVTGHRSKGADFQTEIGSTIDLQQVLRDPPGSGSYAYIKSGASWHPHYTFKVTWQYGLKFTLIYGTNYDNVVGMYTSGSYSGVTMKGSSATEIPIPIVKGSKYYYDWDYTYSTETEIKTSDENTKVGSPANIYIGTENSVVCNRNESFTAIDQETYERIKPSILAGTVREVASGTDAEGKKYHLVIAEDISYSPAVKSKFAYTQDHILNQLIPSLFEQRNSLLVDGDEDYFAKQEEAGLLKKAVYLNTAESPDSIGLKGHYKIFGPHMNDEIDNLNNTILQWMKFVIMAERAVVNGSSDATYLGTYNFNGGASVAYEEASTASYSFQNYDAKGSTEGLIKYLSTFGSSKLVGTGASWAYDAIMKKYMSGYGLHLVDQYNIFLATKSDEEKEDIQTISAFTPGSKFDFKLEPVWERNETQDNLYTMGYSRTSGFVLKEIDDSYMSVSVYRVTNNEYNDSITKPWRDVVYNGNPSMKVTDANDPSLLVGDFVYYTQGGATRCPYIGEERTVLFEPGTLMNKGTMQIDRAMMSAETKEISNVPQSGSAVFNLDLWNESDTNPGVSFYDDDYILKPNEYTNADGLVLSIDGQNITNGMKFRMKRGEVLHKQLVAKCGTVHDYEDVELLFMPVCDWEKQNYTAASSLKLSVHFTPTAGDVNISSPRANWTMNTLSAKDSIGYYVPVVIDGYDVNYKNFDHIELQYKLTDESDDDWVNLCSFYANDSLYTRASGNKKMIDNYSGTITYPFYGERDPMEQKYDLRAVNYCKYGNSFVTKTSSVLSGVKDTRLPRVFGYPEPADGILGIGDAISIPFSEDIAGQYLDEDANFQVIGYTNSTTVNESTSLQFTDTKKDTYAKSKVTRNLNDKDFSIDIMVRPETTNKRMAYFSQGSTVADHVEFGQTEDKHLYATIGSKTVTSAEALALSAFTRVVMTYNKQSGSVHFYAGNQDITNKTQGASTLPYPYKGVGEICLGAGYNSTSHYAGRMIEARLWSKELDLSEITTTSKVLTGYERKLLAYYPMNEGRGEELLDKANGATLYCNGGTSWNTPGGLSLKLDGKDGVQLEEKEFTIPNNADYTLSFWFMSEGRVADNDSVAVFSTGRGVKNEVGAESKMFIGFEKRKFVVRSNGFVQNISGEYDNGGWHHFVMPVDRTRNIASVFIDNKEMAVFSADSISGISSVNTYLGACHWSATTEAGDPVEQTKHYAFNGYIDDVALWEAALPKSYLDVIQNTAPTGEELGLLCYLPFNQTKKNGNSIYESTYSPNNEKVFYDDKHKKVDKQIRLIKSDDVANLVSTAHAPITEETGLTKMKFSWMSRENQLLISLDMLDKEINKNNIFITVRDVKDLHGNLLADPVMWTVYVDRSQLKWEEKSYQHYTGYDVASSFDMNLNNLCGTQTTYKIDGLPSWLKVNNDQGIIIPEGSTTVKFTVDKNLDPGQHTSIVYVTDQNGLSEPLGITVEVDKNTPNWTIDPHAMYTMNIVADVKIQDPANNLTYYDTDVEDYVGAFVGGQCVGVANITYENNVSSLYMTLHGTGSLDNQKVTFRLWRNSTYEILGLTPSKEVIFKDNGVAGSPDDVLHLVTNESGVQSIDLNSGWNWISFNIKPSTEGTDFTGSFASAYDFESGDYIKSDGKFAQYEPSTLWQGTLHQFDHTKSYMVKVTNPGTLEVIGSTLNSDADRKVVIKQGWNYLPYLNTVSTDIKTALGSYFEKASVGDIIKGYDEFAMLGGGADGTEKVWSGSLTYLRPGKGYMIYRTANGTADITFNSSNSQEEELPEEGDSAKRRYIGAHSGNMPIVATVNDDAEGVALRAVSGDEIIGEATQANDGNYYLMTSAMPASEIAFQLIDAEGNVLSSTAPIVAYNEATHIGSVDAPFVVDFSGQGASAKPTCFTDRILFQATAKAGDAVQIDIFDATGAKCWTNSGTATDSTYSCTASDLNSLSAGVYVASIKVAEKTYKIKLIKK